MVEFRRPPEGPGEVIDRRGTGAGPRTVGGNQPLHPFGPRIMAHNQAQQREEFSDMREQFAGQDDELSVMLTEIFNRLSMQVAGGARTDPRDLLPEVQNPDEGVIPEEFLPDVEGAEWFDPTVWARANPDDISKVDLSNLQAATGQGKEGKGLDWFRTGQAPNNYANRHNPLYKARRDFAVAIAPQIERMFGVSAQGSAGYIRTPSAGDAAPGGRAANSDHQSGGAIDFFGTKEEMVALRNWATTQPFVSFVRCQSESHWDHVHLSFDIGWIAQNYFQGRELPPIQKAPSAGTSRRKTTQQGFQVADDPTANRAI